MSNIKEWTCRAAHSGDLEDIRHAAHLNLQHHQGRLSAVKRELDLYWIGLPNPQQADPIIKGCLDRHISYEKDLVDIYSRATKVDQHIQQANSDKSVLVVSLRWSDQVDVTPWDIAEEVQAVASGFAVEQVFAACHYDEPIHADDEDNGYCEGTIYLFCKDNSEAMLIRLAA